MGYALDDTIVAISTPIGEGGIGIVRLSGRDSLSIADKIFKSKDGKLPSRFRSYTTHYGHIIQQCEIIDEVILTVMRAPKSYTKEDIVEINCHGGIVPLKKTLEFALSLGARLAEPGEFTKRAFLNGRIDLAQAESVLDIIKSKTDTSLRAAMGQLEGRFSGTVRMLRGEIADLLSRVEASIDFPEEDIEILSECALDGRVKAAIKKLKELINTAERGRILMEGLKAVICGRTNVGKSSLMNSLLRESRVIVSHIPGTTRDAIEEMININGIPVRIIDTAGITSSGDALTKESVQRSRSNIKSADLALFMLDAGSPLSGDDRAIALELKGKKIIIVINKIDLSRKISPGEIEKTLGTVKTVEISATKNINIDKLEEAIAGMAWEGEVATDHTAMVTNARHKILLIEAKEALERVSRGLEEKTPPEFVALDIKEAVDSLGGITGETIDGEILDRIFSKFCIGK